MSTLRATKNAIERHEAKYGRNVALRRAFNLTGGARPNIGILKNGKLVFGGSFTAAHKWLKNGQKKVDVSRWEVAPVDALVKLCEKKHTAQCNKLARAMPKGLKLRVVMDMEALYAAFQHASCANDLSKNGTPSERKKYGPLVKGADGKRISGRNSPPYPANDIGCRERRRQGNDGLMYRSEGPNKRGVYRWKKETDSFFLD